MSRPGFAIYVASGSCLWRGGNPPPDLSFPIPIAIASERNRAERVIDGLARVVPETTFAIESLPCEASHAESRRIRRCLLAAREGSLGPDVQRLVIEADRLLQAEAVLPSFGPSDAAACSAAGDAYAQRHGPPSRIKGRPQLIAILKKAEDRLRLLATVEHRGGDWFQALGEAFEHFAAIHHGLGTIGFLTEAEELIRRRDGILQTAAPVVVSGVSEHRPKEASELAQVLGIPADSAAETIERATAAVVEAALEMADWIARVCQWVQATPVPIPEDAYQTESDVENRARTSAAATSSVPPGVDPLALAALARRTADRIRKVPYLISHILDSDPWPEIRQVREQLQPLRISVDFLPVVTYVGRSWTPAHAQKLAGQIQKVTNEIDGFLSWYKAMTATYTRENFRWRREERASFLPMCLMIAQEVAQWAADIEARGQREARQPEPDSYAGYAPADTLWLKHGIPGSRLSEGKNTGKIRSKPAPAGIKDSEGRAVRVYYHVADALKNCSPRHLAKRNRKRRSNS